MRSGAITIVGEGEALTAGVGTEVVASVDPEPPVHAASEKVSAATTQIVCFIAPRVAVSGECGT
jgi:hypothetical protein